MVRNAFFIKWIYFWGSLVGILVLVAVLAFYFFGQVSNDLEQELQRESRSLESLIDDVSFLKKQQSLFLKYSGSFQRLIEDGLSKDQDRVLWADIMLKEKQRLMLNPLSVILAPQRPLASSMFTSLTLDSKVFFSTDVEIKGSQYVDTDFFTIFYDIYHYITPFYLVKSCEVNSVASRTMETFETKAEPGSPSFNFYCSIVLFNSKPRPFKGPT